jgi:hypothetical protein
MRVGLSPQSILTGYASAGLLVGTALVAAIHWYWGMKEGWLSSWMLKVDSLAIVAASAAVGAYWGLVHLATRSAEFGSTRDQNRLDYCDSMTWNFPPGSS